MADVRAAVYLRQSQDRSDNRLGIDRQRDTACGSPVSAAWTAAQVFTETHSASNRKVRPAYAALVTMIDAKRPSTSTWSGHNRTDFLRRLATLRTSSTVPRGRPSVSPPSARLGPVTDSGRSSANPRVTWPAARSSGRAPGRERRSRRRRGRQKRRVGGGVRSLPSRRSTIAAVEAAASGTLRVRAGRSAARWHCAGLNAAGLHPGTADPRWQAVPLRHDNVSTCLLKPRYAGLRAYNGRLSAPAVCAHRMTRTPTRAAVFNLEHTSDRQTRRGRHGRPACLTGVAVAASADNGPPWPAPGWAAHLSTGPRGLRA
jgi:hypothetical protein